MIFEASDTTNRKLVSGNSSWPSSPCDGANPARAIASLFISGQENPGVKKPARRESENKCCIKSYVNILKTWEMSTLSEITVDHRHT